MTPLTRYWTTSVVSCEKTDPAHPWPRVYLASDVARREEEIVKAINSLLKAMESGHHKAFSYTLKGYYCPKCNIGWPCGELAEAQRLLRELEGA